MKLRYTPQALNDLQELYAYISDTLGNPTAAKQITKAVLDACATLQHFPELGVSIGAKTGFETDLRMLVCKNQIALYRIDVDCDTVSISRIINAKQDYMRILFGDVESMANESSSPE